MDTDFKKRLSRIPKFDENMLKAFENRKLVFFIGAGVSRVMGVPGWSDFSARLIKKAFPSYKDYSTILKEITDSKERITIAYNQFSSKGKLQEFYDCFGENMKPDLKTFASKENIYEILSNFDATFLTTNADNLFENILTPALCHENCDVATLNNELYKNQNHLFYLHGHYTDKIDINNNNLVFTAAQYVKRYNDESFAEFLRAIFQKDNIIIFVGYGLGEFELIDYMITKSGYTKASDRKVYLLHGFCDNEEIIHKAKLAYFEELNIGVIPFDMSKNGYDSLIDVLKALLDDYRNRTIVPVTKRITNCINNYNEENYAEISRLLKNEHFAHTNEPQITRDIQEQKNNVWTRRFYEDGLFSMSRLAEKTEYRAWPLLELFSEWIESGDEDAQKAALTFLSEINSKHIEKLSQTHTPINSFILRMVFAIKKSNIKGAHITLLKQISKNNNLFYYELPHISDYTNVLTWPKSIIIKLFDVIFEKVNLDTFRDNMSYSIKHFFKHLNTYICNKRIATILFGYLVKLIINSSKPNSYCLFLRIYDLDHIKNNHQELWTAVFEEINFVFSKLDKKAQKSIITKLLYNDSLVAIKLGFYLARKQKHNISSEIIDGKFFSSYDYFHECYLLVKWLSENNYLVEEQCDRLCEIISVAKFGIDSYKNIDNDDYFTQVISSKRLLLLQLLLGDKSHNVAEKLIQCGITPYPSTEMADQCDYVHSAEWDNETYISNDMFNDIPYENWCAEFEKLSAKHTNDYALSSCCRQFARILIEQSDEAFSSAICNLKNIKKQLVTVILYELRSNRDKLSSHDDLVKSCLDILDLMIFDQDIDKQCAKSIFSILSDINIQNETLVRATLSSIIPWLSRTIDENRAFNDDNHVLHNLINYGDYEKITVLLNSFITLKKICNYVVTSDDIGLLLNIIKNDNINKTGKYTLCYNYQNLKYIAPKDSYIVSDAILNENPLDMIALVFCILNSNYIFNELVDKIKSDYLNGDCTLPDSCKDRILSDRFYSYLISSRYYNTLTEDEFQKAYTDLDFLKYFLRSIHIWAEKENFELAQWMIPCWDYVKAKYKDDILVEFAEDVLHSVDDVRNPTEDLLELYLDVVKYCGKRSCIYAKIPKILPFFDIDAKRAANLLFEIFSLEGYTSLDDLELVIKKHKEHGLSREASVLLNTLSQNGEISTKTKESLAEILN